MQRRRPSHNMLLTTTTDISCTYIALLEYFSVWLYNMALSHYLNAQVKYDYVALLTLDCTTVVNSMLSVNKLIDYAIHAN